MSSSSRPTCKEERPVDSLAAARGEAAMLLPPRLASGDVLDLPHCMHQVDEGGASSWSNSWSMPWKVYKISNGAGDGHINSFQWVWGCRFVPKHGCVVYWGGWISHQ